MFEPNTLIIGLEVGTSKVCAMVGEINGEGEVSIVGIGQARSRGVRKGEIVDPAVAEEDIRNAIVDAEQMADVEIRSVYLGVTGAHVSGFNNRGGHPVLSPDREIVQADVEDVVKNAKAINLPMENAVLHTIRQHFLVDGQEGVQNPVGMLGSRLEVDVHVVHGYYNRLQNAIRSVKSLQVDVESIAFNGLASAMAVLTNEQKEMGALVIDLGAGTTEYVVHTNGIVRYSGVLAVGGDHVTNDLAIGLKIPLARAEQLKLEHGSALVDAADRGQTIRLAGQPGLPERAINRDHLRRIMSLRLEETLRLIEQDLDKAGLLDYLRAGVILCGGGARVPEIERLAERVFQLPVTAAPTCVISGLASALNQPEFATGVGLVKFGALQQQRQKAKPTLVGGLASSLTSFFRRS
jgi:cell division protein FtsA